MSIHRNGTANISNVEILNVNKTCNALTLPENPTTNQFSRDYKFAHN